MSKFNKQGANKKNPLDLPYSQADDGQFGANPFPGRWSNPRYLADLAKQMQIRESNKLPMQTASDIKAEPKKWILPGLLQEGEITVLAGPVVAGKTTIACAIAAAVTRGKSYHIAPGLTPTGRGHVLIINKEDNVAKSLLPRLEAADADMDRVHFIDCKARVAGDPPFSFSNEEDIARLVGKAHRLDNNVGLIIIDPIYFAVDGDMNNNAKARDAYERLTALAAHLRCAILGIAHTTRHTSGKTPVARVAGPPALREVPRAILLLWKISRGPTETGGTHVMVHAKNNESSMDGGFEYRLEPIEIDSDSGPIETTKFIATATLVGSAEDLLEQADRSAPVKNIKKLEAAVQFLQDVLSKGPRLWIEIKQLAADAGVKLGTLQNARASLKIVTQKRTGDGRSVWRLPDAT